jgi:ribulose kinase
MKSLIVEILIGHDIGLANSYYKPSQQELLEDYLKSIDLLTIQENKSKLEKQIKNLWDLAIKLEPTFSNDIGTNPAEVVDLWAIDLGGKLSQFR